MLAGGDKPCGVRVGTRDDVKRASQRVCAMHRRGGAKDHLDSIDAEQGGRDLAVVVAALAVIQPDAVDQDQRLSERGAPQAEVGLHVLATARLGIDARHQPEAVDD